MCFGNALFDNLPMEGKLIQDEDTSDDEPLEEFDLERNQRLSEINRRINMTFEAYMLSIADYPEDHPVVIATVEELQQLREEYERVARGLA
jgi:hypothetical protein